MTALINEWNRPPLAALSDPARLALIIEREAAAANAYLSQVGG